MFSLSDLRLVGDFACERNCFKQPLEPKLMRDRQAPEFVWKCQLDPSKAQECSEY